VPTVLETSKVESIMRLVKRMASFKKATVKFKTASDMASQPVYWNGMKPKAPALCTT
jgi:hypothetical protein